MDSAVPAPRTLSQLFEEKIGREHLAAVCFVARFRRQGPRPPYRGPYRGQGRWHLEPGAPSPALHQEACGRFATAHAEVIEEWASGRLVLSGRPGKNYAAKSLLIDLHPDSRRQARLSPCHGLIGYRGTVWREVVEAGSAPPDPPPRLHAGKLTRRGGYIEADRAVARQVLAEERGERTREECVAAAWQWAQRHESRLEGPKPTDPQTKTRRLHRAILFVLDEEAEAEAAKR